MSHNWLFTVAYDGTSYSGWQIQPEAETVQAVVEKELSSLFSIDARIFATSRTDAGVHALAQKFSFLPPDTPPIPAPNVLVALNRSLPIDIRVRTIEEMPPDFHARHNAVGKTYTYVIFNGVLESPFCCRYCWSVGNTVAIEQMRLAANDLIGEHDFTAFSVTSSAKNADLEPVKTIQRLEIRDRCPFVLISVTGNSFLYKMVRRLVGYLVDVGQGRVDYSMTGKILHAKRGTYQFNTAPPQGLFLEKIFFDKAEMISYEPVDLPFFDLGAKANRTATNES